MLTPRKKTPDLSLPTLDHGTFDLSTETGTRGTLVVFFRGLHCPACANHLQDLGKYIAAFEERGVNVIAISSDGEERAREMATKVNVPGLRFAYDLPLEKAREWGLYISTSRGKTSIDIMEPDLFSEPGIFMVTPEQSLYYGIVQTMPFCRPSFGELSGALDFVIKNNYPARGEYTGDV
ncbi:MAG: peroxiredoxin-like family protein [Pacificibacter sp.]|jgi:peroxiredoxin|uniref:peroxiredoxin-like family protein n=1 Tax=Pacificibacter sp. TaxID=1917866 RepID=UPI00321BCF53